MAHAIRRVWGTSDMPSSRAMVGMILGRSSAIVLSCAAARSMPLSSASAAWSTALVGTDTKPTRSARSATEPVSQPD